MRLIVYTLWFIQAFNIYAQKESYNWYFGVNAGITFNNGGSPSALIDGELVTFEGCATISDRGGNLLFYTQGEVVWNKHHEVMDTLLAGHYSSAQSSIIVPKPGFSHLYYIFTAGKVGDNEKIAYSTVDMNLNNGKGGLIEKNILLMFGSDEQLTCIKHENNIDYWVITRKCGTNEYYSYKITSMGVSSSPVVSKIGKVSSCNTNANGYLKSTIDGKKIVSAGLSNFYMDIYDFNKSNGTLSNRVEISDNLNEKFYGVEFSPSGKFIYCTTEESSSLYQYDISIFDSISIHNSKTLLYQNVTDKYPCALQIGPDYKIYIAIGGKNYLGVINNPNTKGLGSNLVIDGVDLKDRISTLGLPNFPSYYLEPFYEIQADKYCVRDTFEVFLNTNQMIDSVHWFFSEDPLLQKRMQANSIICSYNYSGNYVIYAIIWKDGKSTLMEQNIVIYDNPSLYLGDDITQCQGELVYLNVQTDDLKSYEWSTGSSSYDISITQTGSYSVTVTDKNNCKASDTIDIHFEFCSFFIPNAFTPNENDINEMFLAKGENLEYFSIKIYDRWGALVFTSEDIKSGWDGMKNNIFVKQDIYTYCVEYKFSHHTTVYKKYGSVALLK